MDLQAVRECLRAWLAARLEASALSWLDGRIAGVRDTELPLKRRERLLFMGFSAAPRKTGKQALNLSDEELATARSLRAGWQPESWSCDQVGRVLLVLSWPSDDGAAYRAILDKIFETGDLGELVALYQALPLFPEPELHKERCAEGVRTNMTSVFTAVAHGNPYPKEYLDEGAWNQMVLKSLFVGVPLYPIVGLDERSNTELTGMLCDYAHERWAAGRLVSPELWRCVALAPTEQGWGDLQRALSGDDKISARGAALALKASSSERAGELLAGHEALLEGQTGWADLVSSD